MKTTFILIGIFFSFLANGEVLTIALENKPWSPYYLGNKEVDLKKPGLTIELLKMVEEELKLENIKFKYARYPWKRCLDGLKKNKVDAVLGASFKKSRMEIGHYPMKEKSPDDTMGIANSSYSFYKLKSSSLGWDGKSFLNLKGGTKIGVSAGYSIADDLKKMKINIYSAKGSKNLLEMLLRQRVSGFAGFTDIVDNLIKKDKNKYASIIKSKEPIKEKSYYLVFSKALYKRNPLLVQKIWKSIKKLRTGQKYLDLELSYRE